MVCLALGCGCRNPTVIQWCPLSAAEVARREAKAVSFAEAGIKVNGTQWDGIFEADFTNRVVSVPMRLDVGGFTGLPHVRVRIGELEDWWLVDTGADYTTLEAPDATRFGLRLLRTNDVGPLDVTGIGAVVPGRFALLPATKLGDLTITGQHLSLVLQGEHRKTLLGIFPRSHQPMRILGALSLRVAPRVTFDYPAGKLEFAPDSVKSPPPGALELPLMLREHRTFTRLNVQGREVECLVDTGLDAELDLPHALLKEVGVLGPGTKVSTGIQAGVGGERKVEVFRLPQLTLQGRRFENVSVKSGAAGGNAMGTGFLKRFRVTFDFPGQRIFLEEPTMK